VARNGSFSDRNGRAHEEEHGECVHREREATGLKAGVGAGEEEAGGFVGSDVAWGREFGAGRWDVAGEEAAGAAGSEAELAAGESEEALVGRGCEDDGGEVGEGEELGGEDEGEEEKGDSQECAGDEAAHGGGYERGQAGVQTSAVERTRHHAVRVSAVREQRKRQKEMKQPFLVVLVPSDMAATPACGYSTIRGGQARVPHSGQMRDARPARL
jgi:hypothetical protein